MTTTERMERMERIERNRIIDRQRIAEIFAAERDRQNRLNCAFCGSHLPEDCRCRVCRRNAELSVAVDEWSMPLIGERLKNSN